MGFRASLAVFGSIAVFFVGLVAVGMQAEIVQPTVMNSSADGSSAAYNATEGIFAGAGQIASPAVVIGGVAVFLLLCVGVLVAVYGRAR